VEGYHLIAGLATTRTLPNGEVTLGAFIEHGEGDYDTYNSFANAASVHGKGDADYTGGGLFAHLEFDGTERGHAYAEASARLGKVELDFSTRDLIDALGRRAAYDSDSRYASAHAGLGYVLNLTERDSLELYGQTLWSRQGSDTVRLTTGEPVKFAAVDSQRIRLGARWNRAVNKNGKLYLGAAWEREHDGKARASIHGYRLATPDMKGDTGLVEAGFTLASAANQPLTLDLGIQGHAGKREGVTGSARVNYRF
jgi:outer membrane autotransporter protein